MRKLILLTVCSMVFCTTAFAKNLRPTITNHSGHRVKVEYSAVSKSPIFTFANSAISVLGNGASKTLRFFIPIEADSDYSVSLTFSVMTGYKEKSSHQIYHVSIENGHVQGVIDDARYPIQFEHNPHDIGDFTLVMNAGESARGWYQSFWQLFGW